MDLSRLDTGLPEAVVCVPGSWMISQDKPVVRQIELGNEDISMEELLDMTVPVQKKRVSPNARFEIPKVTHITPEMQLELAAIRLRRFAYKDKFMKNSDSKDIPTRFQIGTVVGGGMEAVGGGKESQAAGTSNRRRKKGKSHLANLLRDDTVKNWLHKNIQKRQNVARPKSKNYKRN
jgi:hypothetical protein